MTLGSSSDLRPPSHTSPHEKAASGTEPLRGDSTDQGRSSPYPKPKQPGELQSPRQKLKPSNHSENLGQAGLRGPAEEKGTRKSLSLGLWLGVAIGQCSSLVDFQVQVHPEPLLKAALRWPCNPPKSSRHKCRRRFTCCQGRGGAACPSTRGRSSAPAASRARGCTASLATACLFGAARTDSASTALSPALPMAKAGKGGKVGTPGVTKHHAGASR